ncbi:ABC transporter substrate-binding protein [Paenibacillus sinopodophylli]|uniref:ABC transporter substrate-binding protein n=1 Tax=Paenibacillus sinopodophylli TaxID=1837342 RepID=UPI001FECCBB1|nr:ABC transporter substrate-binding protein [Paenibacillus sinopodophylli]
MDFVRRNVVMLITLTLFLAACSNQVTESDNKEGKDKYAHEVKIKGYLIGEAPSGMSKVLQALNEKLKHDINATLELNYIGWGDLATKYPFILSSGKEIDFVFAADWNFYVSESAKGTFLPLDPDLLRKHMPVHMNNMSPEALEAAYVNGMPYMIPTSTPDRKVSMALFRKDLMEQAGMTEITKFSDIEPYLAAAKMFSPTMIPLNLDSQFDLPSPYMYLLSEKFAFGGAPIDSGDPMAQGVTTDNEDPAGQIMSMIEEPVLSSQKYAASMMKSWYDKGYVNRNPFSNKVRSKDVFCEGQSAVAFGNSYDMISVFDACERKGIEVYPFPLLFPSGKVTQTSWLNNGIAIAANSKNPERTMEALDLIMEDPDYVNLTYYGIEGEHYKLTADGTVAQLNSALPEEDSYPPDASGFWFVNKDQLKPMSTWTDSYINLKDRIDDYLEPSTYLGFSFNPSEVKEEVAALKAASMLYAQPLYIGAVDDIDASFEQLISNLKAAGIDTVKQEVEKQTAEYRARQ